MPLHVLSTTNQRHVELRTVEALLLRASHGVERIVEGR